MMNYTVAIFLFACLASGVQSYCDSYKPNDASQQLVLNKISKFGGKFGSNIIESEKSPNLIYSPLSAYYLLFSTVFGTSGTTADELLSALELPSFKNLADICHAINVIDDSLTKFNQAKYLDLNIANAVIVGRNLQISPYYLNFTTQKLHAEVLSNHGSDLQLHKLANSWVEEKTNHKIKSIVSEDIDDNRSLILANTIYFNASWLFPFSDKDFEEKFYDLNNQPKLLKMIKLSSTLLEAGFVSDLKSQFVILPYQNYNYKLVVVWPTNHLNCKEFLELGQKISLRGYNNITANKQKESLDFYMPEFKVESSFNLKPILQQMNVNELFSNGDFKNLFVDVYSDIDVKIVQKAFIEVAKTGTVAAAASAVAVTLRASFDTEVIVNRPFYYAIVSPEGTLFEGRVEDPLSS